jgi:HSP20 family protein
MNDLERHEPNAAPRGMSRWIPDVFGGQLMPDLEPIKVEEQREDDALVVRAEVPGLDPEKDVNIEVSDQALRIQAERREQSRDEQKGRVRSEFRYGSFTRVLPLPFGASEDDVKATYRDGILEVRIPIDQRKAEAHKIPVQRA